MEGKGLTLAFDAWPLATQAQRKNGIGLSTLRLARALARAPYTEKINVLFYCMGRKKIDALLPNSTIRYISKPTRLPAALKRDGVDLIHFNDYFSPLYSPKQFAMGRFKWLPTVITVYDLIPFQSLFFKGRMKGAKKIKRNLVPVLKNVSKIRANSNDTKDELVRMAKLKPNKIEVIYHGIEHSTFHPNYSHKDINLIRNTYGLDRAFILQVGSTNNFRKNHITLAKAYQELVRQDKNFPLHLVFAGRRFDENLLSYVKNCGLDQRVKFLESAPHEHLPLIYNAAYLFAFPSLYEGFGNPPLEAMACGVPVISSDRGALPEILGDGAIYINPLNPSQLAHAINDLYRNPGKRVQLIEKGLQHAQKYSWENTASQLVNLYLDILAGGQKKSRK